MQVHFQNWHSEDKKRWNSPIGLILSVPCIDRDAEMQIFLNSLASRGIKTIACIGEFAEKVEDLIDWYLTDADLSEVATTVHAEESFEEVCNFVRLQMQIDHPDHILVFEGDPADPFIAELRQDKRVTLII